MTTGRRPSALESPTTDPPERRRDRNPPCPGCLPDTSQDISRAHRRGAGRLRLRRPAAAGRGAAAVSSSTTSTIRFAPIRRSAPGCRSRTRAGSFVYFEPGRGPGWFSTRRTISGTSRPGCPTSPGSECFDVVVVDSPAAARAALPARLPGWPTSASRSANCSAGVSVRINPEHLPATASTSTARARPPTRSPACARPTGSARSGHRAAAGGVPRRRLRVRHPPGLPARPAGSASTNCRTTRSSR